MKKGFLHSTLINQEQRAVKLFLLLIYSIWFAYDFFYYYVLPNYISSIQDRQAQWWLHIIALLMLPAALRLARNKPNAVKYLYLTVYVTATLAGDLIEYVGSDKKYSGGSVVEVLLVLFSPLFLSKRYFWMVIGGITFKYAVIGLAKQDADVFIPLLLLIVLSAVSFILLNRFLGYVDAVKNSYNLQIEGIVKGIVATLELKDPYTRGHSERVAYYSLVLAKKMNLFTEEEMKSFYYACLLHDLGKVHIPDHILAKPSSLTDQEYEVIKTHPEVGANAIRGIEGLTDSLDVVLQHHERWDGNGYPNRLKGEQISLLARIAAVADAFDAMTSKRSYREALSLEEAYARILNGKGTQFDPTVVERFQEVFPIWVNYIRSRESQTASESLPAKDAALPV